MNNDLEKFSEERLKEISELTGAYEEWSASQDEIHALARIALAAKQAKPIGEIRLSEYRSDGTREASVVCLHDQADWDNFTDGSLLYLNPQPAHTEQVIPDSWKLVPIEPTPAMCEAGYTARDKWNSMQCDNQKELHFSFSQPRYKAMLAAAPKPESE